MTDIVERLQKATLYEGNGELSALPEEAADEIVALRAENERLREWNAEIALNAREFAEALREIINFDTDEDISNEECMRDIARAALEGK